MSCVRNPYYSGAGNETDYYDTPFYDSESGESCTPIYGGSNPRIPQIIATPGGITSNNNKLDSMLGAILSGLALIKGARQVPTTVSGEAPPTIIYQQNPQGGGGGGGGGNVGGQIQSLIQRNPGAFLLGGVVVVALFMKPPTKK